ncbi:hypothetical protein CL655_00730 [bacterium]|nr:hypothetical protein [bacterium]
MLCIVAAKEETNMQMFSTSSFLEVLSWLLFVLAFPILAGYSLWRIFGALKAFIRLVKGTPGDSGGDDHLKEAKVRQACRTDADQHTT